MKSERSSANSLCLSSAACARSIGRSRGSCTDSALAMISTSLTQRCCSAASNMRAMRGSSGSLAELLADLGQPPLLVQRVQFGQQLIAVADQPRARRVDEGKAHHVAQPQRLHAQDDASQRGAQQFGIGEARAVAEIGFVVQADADAVRHPPAAPGALVGRRLRDFLDQQLLDLVARRIAFDPRGAGIDHVADARHGERGFRHVGGQHDAPRLIGLENASCSATDRRENSGRISVPGGWCLRSASAVSRISRSPGRNTRMSPEPSAPVRRWRRGWRRSGRAHPCLLLALALGRGGGSSRSIGRQRISTG